MTSVTGDPAEVARRLLDVASRIEQACRRAGRVPADVTVVAVTKGHPVEAARAAFRAGLEDLGENYVQDLEPKRAAVPGARWHYLGRVQSNKADRIASAADLIHGLEPGRGAGRLAAAGRRRGKPVRALLEVDFTARRQGVVPRDVARVLEELRSLEGLELAGLMTVAPEGPTEDPRRWFAALRELRDREAEDLRDLSMGMSGDFPVAVEEGATIVRIGTALFGDRPTKKET